MQASTGGGAGCIHRNPCNDVTTMDKAKAAPGAAASTSKVRLKLAPGGVAPLSSWTVSGGRKVIIQWALRLGDFAWLGFGWECESIPSGDSNVTGADGDEGRGGGACERNRERLRGATVPPRQDYPRRRSQSQRVVCEIKERQSCNATGFNNKYFMAPEPHADAPKESPSKRKFRSEVIEVKFWVMRRALQRTQCVLHERTVIFL